MQITSVELTSIAQMVAVTTSDGIVWHDDLTLPADTAFRKLLAAWVTAGGVPTPYVAPAPPVPQQISDLQFAMQARNQGFISQDEAVAFVSNGTIPAAMVAIIDTLPTQQQKDDATLTVSGTKVFLRNDPLTITIGTAFATSTGASNAAAFMDAFFVAAAALA